MAWIHPFGDGNGRTARLVEFKILLQAGLPEIAVHLLSNHYNLTRDEYYRQLDYASKSGGDITRFIEYALQGLVDGLQAQIDTIHAAQYEVHWRDHVYRTFDDTHSPADVRRRQLLIDLVKHHVGDYISIEQLRELTPRVALAYASKSDKTLRRDITALQEMGLLRVRRGEIAANLDILQLFISRRVEPSDAQEDD